MPDHKTFKAPNFNARGFAQEIANYYQNEGYEVNVVESANGVMIQSRAKDMVKRGSVALATTATIQGENVMIQTGQAKWGTNAVVGVAAAIVFWPLLAFPAYTSYKQKKLIDETWDLVDRYMVSIGAPPAMTAFPMNPPMQSPQAPPPVAPAGRTCPSCGTALKAEAKFCDNCGAKLSNTCSKCGAELRPGAKFCENCGSPVG